MKIEEAIEYLKITKTCAKYNDYKTIAGLEKQMCDVAIQSLEKQIVLRKCIENLKDKDCFVTDRDGVVEMLKTFLIGEE